MKGLLLTLGAVAVFTAHPTFAQSEAQIRQRIIRESIESYPGSCPCPYSVARNGSKCGARSAWSRGGGYAPKCFASDVSRADIDTARR
ncbi:MAG: hypothetical protein EON93_10665 [Burkholderiales bacterium]|nr:MAG: hypothetical protein EON93_10665 [Burkholderiales bacterium]